MTTETPESHAHDHGSIGRAVASISKRLGVSSALTGRGVTIAFLDSGFFPHADLVTPENRVLAYHDVTDERVDSFDASSDPNGWQWHGTQTTVVGCGNGRLSGGLYRGLACEADLVLVKVGVEGRISDASIVKGLRWVLENHRRFGIRVVNLSLGGDRDSASAESEVDRAAEALVDAGIVVVAASGNAGCGPDHTPIPPANSPRVLTVGGYDDGGLAEDDDIVAYCSSYGLTADGILKPEIIGPAAVVAAPLLPGTDDYKKAAALATIVRTPASLLKTLDSGLFDLARITWADLADGPVMVREIALHRLRESRVVSAHYQYVDGTSFAAPIVASLVALMIEANPDLTPTAIRSILLSTAKRAPGIPAARQGFGMVNAPRALELASGETHSLAGAEARPPYCDGPHLIFHFHDDHATRVSLAGSFNDWQERELVRTESGVWRAELPVPDKGEHRYKFVIDGTRWVDDPFNAYRESDPYGGHNSVVVVECDE